MDMNDVAVFVKVVEAGSFTGAAKLLKQPKTTVSRKVARLEEALGARLLQRTTRSVSLTDTGQRFYRECSDALAAIDAATRSVGEEHGVPSGTIRVSAPADAYFLSEIVAAFLARYERMKVEVVLTDARLNLIEQGHRSRLSRRPARGFHSRRQATGHLSPDLLRKPRLS